jgi:uncharacterized protein
MPFEWDEKKRQWNIANRDLDFADAHDFEMAGARHHVDRRRSYGEVRFVSTGYLHGRLCVLCWTVRNGNMRVISLRRANEREAKDFSGTSG